MYLRNRSDMEDVFQEVFLKHALRKTGFASDAHEKAWLIRVSINACKDLTKSFWHRKVFSLEEADTTGLTLSQDNSDVLDAVLRLRPPKYRAVIYLFYFEGYKATQIAQILGRNENTIYTWLSRAKDQLRATLGGELDAG